MAATATATLQAPEPSSVRPEPILKKGLVHVLKRHDAGADYKAYVNDQLKSIRQDLTVRRVLACD